MPLSKHLHRFKMWYAPVSLACNSDVAQTSEVFSSDLVPKSLRNIHPKKFRRAKCGALATFSVKPKKSFRTAEIWMPGGLHICKSGLRTPLPSRTCWHGSSSEQSAPHTRPCQPHRDEVCLQRVRQRPGVLSWHRKFISVHRHTHQILHAQGVKG